MLSDHQVYAAIPTDDIDELRPFYEDVLGFVPREAAWFRDPDGNLIGMNEFND